MEDFSFLTEAYIGKTKTMLHCEDLLESIIDKVRKSLRVNINKLSENKKLEELLCEQFGFRGLSLYWTDTSIMGPAYTLVGLNFIQTMTKTEYDFVKDDYKKGFYDYQHGKYVVINLSSHMINTYKDITAEHILAMIIHELGHNFSTSPFNIIKSLLLAYEAAIAIPISEALMSNKGKEIIQTVTSIPNEMINKFPAVKEKWFKIKLLFNRLSDILAPINVFNAVYNIAKLPLDLLFFGKNLTQKVIELDADGLSASYGYAKPLAEALDIIMTHGQSGYNPDTRNEFISMMLDMSNVLSTLYMDAFGSHPSNISRLAGQINKLEESLKRGDFEPNMENELQNQINELKYLIENYDKEMKHENFHMSSVINKMYAKQVLK